jgi:molybdopterin-guanine dinucleotide biosynthesis protein A
VTPEASASASAARESQSSIAADSVTGILLVGGASRRFGSPKALARLGGETLAERAWRALAWCDERLAVGKAEELALPFPVLDDAADERAPIFGLRAGLRAARHEVCLVLPVDVPLVTEDALRTLARERAVPQTGPLPGAYARSQLPAVEARIAAGDLSLRGLNPRTIVLEERLLANVNTPADLTALEVRRGQSK